MVWPRAADLTVRDRWRCRWCGRLILETTLPKEELARLTVLTHKCACNGWTCLPGCTDETAHVRSR